MMHKGWSSIEEVPYLNIYESLWYQNITRSADNKLRTYSSIKTKFCLEPYIIHTGTSKRRNITRLRISCHPLAVETGRYNKPKTPIGQRICEHCDLNQIENEHHMIFVCPFYTDERKSLFENLSEFTSASWQPSFFTFKTILTMADGDPDFITPVCGFVDACFAKKKAIYELQMKLWYSQKCSHISVQPQSTPAFCGAPTASRQMGTHCGGVANDCRWLCPTYTHGCLYMWTPKCFNYLSTNVNCHQASYWILIL